MNPMSLSRPIAYGYAAAAFMLSGLLLYFATTKGVAYVLFAGAFYLATAFASLRLKAAALPVVAALAMTAGWMATHFHGYNIHISAGILCLSAGISVVLIAHKGSANLSTAHLLLGGFSALSLVSAIFVAVRYLSFTVVPELTNQSIALNSFGHTSDNAIYNIVNYAANTFSWFGLFLRASHHKILNSSVLPKVVFSVWALNTIALIVQMVNPEGYFLTPYGFNPGERINGITSFSYAMSSAAMVCSVLLPAFLRSRLGKVLIVPMLVFLGAATYFSRSRTCLAVFVIYIIILLAYNSFSRRVNLSLQQRAVIISIAVLIMATLAIVYISLPDITYSESPLGRIKVSMGKEGIGSFWDVLVLERLSHYPIQFEMIKRFPLSGVGLGANYIEASKMRDLYLPALETVSDYNLTSNSSNTYLGYFAELGIVPAVLIIAVLLLLMLRKPAAALLPHSLLYKFGLALIFIALLIDPILHNAEAVGWFWLLAGQIYWSSRKDTKIREDKKITVGVVSIAVFILYIGFQFLSANTLSPERQWKKLGWNIDYGFHISEETGRWSKTESALTLDGGRFAFIEWSTGNKDHDHSTEVRFYLNGKLAISTEAGQGTIHSTLLRLPDISHPSLLAIACSDAYQPAEFGEEDTRQLGIFIHSIQYPESFSDYLGFYEPEETATGDRFIWGSKTAHFPLPSFDGFDLTLRGFAVPEGHPPILVTVLVDGLPILSEIPLATSWKTLRLEREDISAALLASTPSPQQLNQHVVTIRANIAYTPAKLHGNKDFRQLSFAMILNEENSE